MHPVFDQHIERQSLWIHQLAAPIGVQRAPVFTGPWQHMLACHASTYSPVVLMYIVSPSTLIFGTLAGEIPDSAAISCMASLAFFTPSSRSLRTLMVFARSPNHALHANIARATVAIVVTTPLIALTSSLVSVLVHKCQVFITPLPRSSAFITVRPREYKRNRGTGELFGGVRR